MTALTAEIMLDLGAYSVSHFRWMDFFLVLLSRHSVAVSLNFESKNKVTHMS